jgi:succinate dehydrogenase / fumarate reductase cytochrome b subunit
VLSTRAYFYATGVETDYMRMHNFMMNPLILATYIVGTLACVYHLTNGIFTFTITWGIAVGAKAQTLVNRVCVLLFVVLAVVSVAILVAFRTPA